MILRRRGDGRRGARLLTGAARLGAAAIAALTFGLGISAASAAPAGWSAPEDLSGVFEVHVQEGAAGNHPDVAVSGAGDAVAAWHQEDRLGDPAEVWMRDRPLGAGWGAPRTLGGGFEPRAATNAGTTVVAWTSGSDIIARVRRGTGDFSPAKNLGRGSEVRTGVDDSGAVTVLWSGGGVDYGIRSARNTAAANWTATTTISFSPTAHEPDLAVSGNGDAIASWTAQDGVRVTEFTPTAGWSTHHLVAPGGSHPSIATNDTGQVVLAWTGPAETVPPTEAIHVLQGTIRGGLRDEEEISDPILWDWWADQPVPEAAIGRGGDAVVAWNRVVSYTAHTATVEVSSTRVGAGWAWFNPKAVSVPTFVPRPSLAVGPDGAVIAAWRGGSASLRAAEHAGISPAIWGAPFPLAGAGADVYNPSIAVDDAGRMHAVWADLSRPHVRYEDHLLYMAVQATSFGSPGSPPAPPAPPPVAAGAPTVPGAGANGGLTRPTASAPKRATALAAPRLSTTVRRGTLYLKVTASLPRAMSGRTLVIQRRSGGRLLRLAGLRVPASGRVSVVIPLNTNSNAGPAGVGSLSSIRVRITAAKTRRASAISSPYRVVPV